MNRREYQAASSEARRLRRELRQGRTYYYPEMRVEHEREVAAKIAALCLPTVPVSLDAVMRDRALRFLRDQLHANAKRVALRRHAAAELPKWFAWCDATGAGFVTRNVGEGAIAVMGSTAAEEIAKALAYAKAVAA